MRSGMIIDQMHNYYLTLSSLSCPPIEYLPIHDAEIANDLVHYSFDGD